MDIKKAFKWYIRGEYHCDKCPYCWSEWSYEGDGDAGCYIYGDLRDTCRLIPPIRTIIGWPTRKKANYYFTHEYDGFAEWNEKEEAKRENFNEAVKNFIGNYYICWKNEDGTFCPIDKDSYINYNAWEIRRDYEEFCNPFVVKTLRSEWKDLIAKTWRKFIGIFKPYFCK